MSIDEIKNFWNNRPCNIRHSSKELGSREYFNEVEKRKYFHEPHIKSFANFGMWKNKDVLEIGCGLGTESINFARAGANLTIVELSEKSLEICKKRFQVFGLNAIFILGNAEDLDKLLGNKKFDLIWSFGVIHHSENPEKIVSQFSNHLKDISSQVRIMVYSKISFKLFDILHTTTWDMARANELIQYWSEAEQACPKTETYTFNEVIQMFNRNSLFVSNIWKDHIFPFDIPEYKKGNYVLAKEWENVSPEDMKMFESELGWHTMIVGSKKFTF